MLITIAILVTSGIVFAALIAFLWRESAGVGPRRGAKKPAAREAPRSRLDDLEMRPRRDRYGPN